MANSEVTSPWANSYRSSVPPTPQTVYNRNSCRSTVSGGEQQPVNSYHRPTVTRRKYGENVQRKFEIEDFQNAFRRKNMELFTHIKLGKGKYSKVYKAMDSKMNRMLAVKAIDVTELTDDVKNKFLPREISCWRKLKHRFIVALYAQYEAQNMIFLAMEYGNNGDMLRFVQKHSGLDEWQAGRYMSQLLKGLNYMHERGIAHRDIKLENIILFDNCAKLSDFGFVRHMESANTLSNTYCGSKSYSAPELLKGVGYNPLISDIWSLGVVGFVMVTNQMPFNEKLPSHVIVEQQKMRQYHIPSRLNLSMECIRSFETMMMYDVGCRPTSMQALQLPWISPHGRDL